MRIHYIGQESPETVARQRVMSAPMVARVAWIADKKGWTQSDMIRILFVQGYGRKSLNAVSSALNGFGHVPGFIRPPVGRAELIRADAIIDARRS